MCMFIHSFFLCRKILPLELSLGKQSEPASLASFLSDITMIDPTKKNGKKNKRISRMLDGP